MRIVCPNCRATYEVPESLMGPAIRQVRCARCDVEWRPAELGETPAAPAIERAAATMAGAAIGRTAPALPPPDAPPEASSTVTPRLDGDAKPYRRRRQSGVRLEVLAALGLSVVLLLGLLVAAYIWRADVIRVWPASQRVLSHLN